MKRSRNTLGPLISYHGCYSSVAEVVLSGRRKLQPNQNDCDWLGPGIYFWIDSPERGLNWAREEAARKSRQVKKPDVIRAFIYPSLCLNLTDHGASRGG